MADGESARGATAGAVLRRARLDQGLHLSALAAAIKMPPAKLELLEADRIDELPGPAFARALALSVCRALKIDPAPVLALLPKAPVQQLERVSRGLNAPFRPGADAPEPNAWLSIRHPAVWAPLLILLAAVAVYLVPADVVRVDGAPAAAPAKATPAPEAPATEVVVLAPTPEAPATPASEAVVETVHAAPDASAAAASAPAAAVPAAPLQLRTRAESWVEVRDAQGQALLLRVLQPGETVSLDGAFPLRVRIGNAAQTEVSLRGKRLDLEPVTRNNIARLELQ